MISNHMHACSQTGSADARQVGNAGLMSPSWYMLSLHEQAASLNSDDNWRALPYLDCLEIIIYHVVTVWYEWTWQVIDICTCKPSQLALHIGQLTCSGGYIIPFAFSNFFASACRPSASAACASRRVCKHGRLPEIFGRRRKS